MLFGLTKATSYTYRAYADSGCEHELASLSFTTAGVVLSTESLVVPEGGSASYDVRLGTQPSGAVEVVLTVPF